MYRVGIVTRATVQIRIDQLCSRASVPPKGSSRSHGLPVVPSLLLKNVEPIRAIMCMVHNCLEHITIVTKTMQV